MAETTETVRILTFWKSKISKFVGEKKQYPSESQFVTEAVQEKIEKLEEKKK